MKIIFTAIVVFSITIVSCKKSHDNINANGTIVKETIDGCVWLIKLDNNQILEPKNLTSFNTVTIKDGQKVSLTYQKSKNSFSICV